jgi:hypothetical protein
VLGTLWCWESIFTLLSLLGMADTLDLFELERYCTHPRYSAPIRGCTKSLLDCVAGLTLHDLTGFTKEEFMREVEREGGPHKQVPAWLREKQELPLGKVCLGEFLVDWEAGPPAAPSVPAPSAPPAHVSGDAAGEVSQGTRIFWPVIFAEASNSGARSRIEWGCQSVAATPSQSVQ